MVRIHSFYRNTNTWLHNDWFLYFLNTLWSSQLFWVSTVPSILNGTYSPYRNRSIDFLLLSHSHMVPFYSCISTATFLECLSSSHVCLPHYYIFLLNHLVQILLYCLFCPPQSLSSESKTFWHNLWCSTCFHNSLSTS